MKFSLAFFFSSLWGLSCGWSVELVEKQSQVKGLLVRSLEIGEQTGSSSQMNATWVPGGEDAGGMRVKFNQDTGDMMTGALREVVKYLRIRHDGWPQGGTVEIGFQEKWIEKDGPSAAVACGLLLQALLTGEEIDAGFSITGDMNATGMILPVGGVSAKIEGAAEGDCQIVGIPQENRIDVSDLLLTQGAAPLWEIQIMEFENFEQAWDIARAERSEGTRQALATFAEIQRVLQKHQNPDLLRNPHVQSRLKEVCQALPQHLSARLLLLHGLGRTPDQLSLSGSLNRLSIIHNELAKAIDDDAVQIGGGLQEDGVADSLSDLRRIRPSLDRRLSDYADSVVDLGQLYHRHRRELDGVRAYSRIQQAILEINQAADLANREWDKILNDRALMKELE